MTNKNGNIFTLERWSEDGMMDDLTYRYADDPGYGVPEGFNRLMQVEDNSSSLHNHDVDNQTDTYNYGYDLRGNLIQDVEGGVANDDLVWYDFGKVQSVTVDRAGYDDYTTSYEYAAEGTRVIKSISKTVGADETRETTNYVIDPSGNPVSIYRATREFDSGMETSREIIQKEIPLYGSSRYGSYMLSRDIEESLVQEYSYNPLDQRFEFSNHLGNVLTTYTARKMGIDDDSDGIVEYYEAEVVTAKDYYPYGLEMLGEADITPANPVSGRVYHNPTFLDDGYRYGFNGKERDPDFHEEVTNYDYGFRIYNPGIARFLSVDPLTKGYPMLTPYQFASNTPIQAIDLDGLEAWRSTRQSNNNRTRLSNEFFRNQNMRYNNQLRSNQRDFSVLESHRIKTMNREEGMNLRSRLLDHSKYMGPSIERFPSIRGNGNDAFGRNVDRVGFIIKNSKDFVKQIDYTKFTGFNGINNVQLRVNYYPSDKNLRANLTQAQLDYENKFNEVSNQYYETLVKDFTNGGVSNPEVAAAAAANIKTLNDLGPSPQDQFNQHARSQEKERNTEVTGSSRYVVPSVSPQP